MKQGWEIKKLSEIGKVFNGNSINEKVKKDKYTNLDNGLPFIATKDVGFDSSIDYENGVRIPFNEINQFKIAPSNTPLICAEGGSAGRKIGFTNQAVCFGNKLFALVPNKNVDSKYIFYYYFTSSFQKHFSTEMAGIIGGVSMNKFKDIEIPLPSLPEQQRIVSILDECFAAIAKAKANAEQNLQNAKELFESYLQGVFEKKGDGWEIKTLGEVSKINYGYTEKASFEEVGPKFLRITDIQENGVDWETVPFCKCSGKDLPKYKLKTGDIVFARTGATTGKSYLIDNPPNSVFASYLIRLRMNSINEFIPEFISYFFQTKTYWDKINAGISGSAQGGFNATKLGELEFYFPKSKEDQQTIVRQLDALRAETQKLEAVYQKKLADLEELKKSILQKAFAGELKTSDVEVRI